MSGRTCAAGLESPAASVLLSLDMTSDSTEQPPSVLASIASGDPDAIQACIDRYSGLIWSLARSMMRTTADAEDAVQEIFLSLWKNAGSFDPSKSSEKSFIAMIARRRLIDVLRKKGRRPKLVAMPENGPDPASDDHLTTQRGVEASVAAEMLKELRPDQRKVIELSIYQGMSHSEIAELTNIPIGTVKSHIWRGLNLVRSRIAEMDERAGSATA